MPYTSLVERLSNWLMAYTDICLIDEKCRWAGSDGRRYFRRCALQIHLSYIPSSVSYYHFFPFISCPSHLSPPTPHHHHVTTNLHPLQYPPINIQQEFPAQDELSTMKSTCPAPPAVHNYVDLVEVKRTHKDTIFVSPGFLSSSGKSVRDGRGSLWPKKMFIEFWGRANPSHPSPTHDHWRVGLGDIEDLPKSLQGLAPRGAQALALHRNVLSQRRPVKSEGNEPAASNFCRAITLLRRKLPTASAARLSFFPRMQTPSPSSSTIWATIPVTTMLSTGIFSSGFRFEPVRPCQKD